MELKYVERYRFTPAQLHTFPLFEKCGIGIWVISGATEEEYAKLFAPPNWREYLHKKDKVTIRNIYPDFEC